MIKHIVMWKFKENEEEKMNEFLEGARIHTKTSQNKYI